MEEAEAEYPEPGPLSDPEPDPDPLSDPSPESSPESDPVGVDVSVFD